MQGAGTGSDLGPTYNREDPMLILSLDTTSRAGSAALVRDGRILVERSGDAALTHGERLPGDLMRVLAAAGTALQDIELFAVAAGPGSFTGLRVGIAAVQGLAMAAGRRVVPVSTLDALAHTVEPAPARLATWVDAQRGEVFATLFDAARRPVSPASSAPPDATLQEWMPLLGSTPVTFVGDGASRYAGLIRGRLGERATVIDPAPLLAGAIGAIAWHRREAAVLPHAVVPIYIRRPDAELERARRQGGSGG